MTQPGTDDNDQPIDSVQSSTAESVSAPFAERSRFPFWPVVFILLLAVGVTGMLAPWFRPELSGQVLTVAKPVHSWNSMVFFVAPVAMLFAAGEAWISMRTPSRARAAFMWGLIAAVMLAVSVVIGIARVPHFYSNWDLVKAAAAKDNLKLTTAWLWGSYVTVVAAGLYLVVSVAGLVLFARARPSDTSSGDVVADSDVAAENSGDTASG